MSNRSFSMSEDEIDSFTLGFEKAISGIETAKDDMSTSFKSTIDSGLMGSSITKLQKNIEKVASFGKNVKNMISKQKQEVFQMEDNLSKKIEDIMVPRDFVKDGTLKYVTIDDIQLTKKDGKSVNNGSDANINHEDKESIVEKETLENINKSDGTDISDLDDDTIISKNEIYDMNNNSSLDETSLEDNLTGEKVVLEDISTNNEIFETEDVSNNFTEQKIKIDDLNNGYRIDTQFYNPSNSNNQYQEETTYSTNNSSNNPKKEKDEDLFGDIQNLYSVYNNFENNRKQVEKEEEQQ